VQLLNIVAPILIVIALAGCAHPIVVAPNTAKIEREAGTPPRIKANAGFFIPAEASSLEVTTPGGGGDNVRYFPYRDLEMGYQKMLFNVFENVTKLKSEADSNELSKDGIKYVLAPDVITSSGSTGFFTWPPTNFTVDLTSKVREASGKMIASPRVVGHGQAEFSEFKSDFGLAGKRAMEDALLKMQKALLEIKFENSAISVGPASDGPMPQKDQTSGRLEKLKDLSDRGLFPWL
jgi:hypothetical protein